MGDWVIVVQKGGEGVRGHSASGIRLQASDFRKTVVGSRSSVVGKTVVGLSRSISSRECLYCSAKGTMSSGLFSGGCIFRTMSRADGVAGMKRHE